MGYIPAHKIPLLQQVTYYALNTKRYQQSSGWLFSYKISTWLIEQGASGKSLDTAYTIFPDAVSQVNIEHYKTSTI